MKKRFLATLTLLAVLCSACSVDQTPVETSAWSNVETETIMSTDGFMSHLSSDESVLTPVVTTTSDSETFSQSSMETTLTSESEASTSTETSVTTVTEVTTESTTITTAETTTANTTSTEATSDNVTTSKVIEEVVDVPTRVVLNVENIQQLPELPAGCEITSTTIVLNHLGFNVDKMDLMDYMPMMKAKDANGRWESPWNVFVGSPEYNYYGCYSPVIKSTIENYFNSNNITGYEVVDMKDSLVYELYEEIDNGNPVIVWATIKMSRSKSGNSWILQDGSSYTWVAGEHCLVLIGYDLVQDTVILSDPYDSRGTVEYPRETFEKRYTELFNQALVVKKTDN